MMRLRIKSDILIEHRIDKAENKNTDKEKQIEKDKVCE